jgi:hypothetical protein
VTAKKLRLTSPATLSGHSSGPFLPAAESSSRIQSGSALSLTSTKLPCVSVRPYLQFVTPLSLFMLQLNNYFPQLTLLP